MAKRKDCAEKQVVPKKAKHLLKTKNSASKAAKKREAGGKKSTAVLIYLTSLCCIFRFLV